MKITNESGSRAKTPLPLILDADGLNAFDGRASELKIFHLEDIGPHYVRTLAQWRRRFLDNLPEVRRLGYSESFVRLWEFYLCYCEGAFAERQLGDVQILLTKPRCRRSPISSARQLSHADE